MAPQSEVGRDGTIGGEKALGLTWGFELVHEPFPLAGRLVGVFCSIIEGAVLPLFDTGQDLTQSRPIALELIRDDHPRHIRQALEEFAEKSLRCLLIPSILYQVSRMWTSWSTARQR